MGADKGGGQIGGGRHDTLSAISEAEATGETAAIFADIRQTMQLPLVTSIWRTLHGVEGGLPAAWAAAKPIYASGQVDAALQRLRDELALPVPEPLVPGQLACAGVSPAELPRIRALVGAYNRSNAMNLLALTGLVSEPAGTPPADPVPAPPAPWPEIPPLLGQDQIAPDTWSLLEHVNRFGTRGEDIILGTLWRHVASHWRGLLALLHAGLAPLQRDGSIDASVRQLQEITRREGARLAHLRTQPAEMPDDARSMIANYVRDPDMVIRMVVLGHALVEWVAPPARGGEC